MHWKPNCYVPPRVRPEANFTVMSCNYCLHFVLVELANMKATKCMKFLQAQLIPTSKGAYHLSELAGKNSLVVRRIPLLIRNIQLDHFIPKWYAAVMGFSKSSKKRLVHPVLTFEKCLNFLGKLTVCKCKLITENKILLISNTFYLKHFRKWLSHLISQGIYLLEKTWLMHGKCCTINIFIDNHINYYDTECKESQWVARVILTSPKNY